jgi:hypothetical protein
MSATAQPATRGHCIELSGFWQIKNKLSIKKPNKRRHYDSKHFYSHLYRGGFFVLMVAHPVQDMPEVSIAPKTVGVRLPCLRRGAIAGRHCSSCMALRERSKTLTKVEACIFARSLLRTRSRLPF